MFANRSRKTVVPSTPLEKSWFRIEDLEDELEELLESGEPEDSSTVELIAGEIEEEYQRYYDLVDVETDAALAEVEDLMERGISVW